MITVMSVDCLVGSLQMRHGDGYTTFSVCQMNSHARICDCHEKLTLIANEIPHWAVILGLSATSILTSPGQGSPRTG